MTDRTDFGTLSIAYDDRVLRPRGWTAGQSAWATDLLASAPPGPVLELCAGAGHIGLLAVVGTGRRLVCVDASEAACDFARANAAEAGLADLVEVRHARLQDAVGPDERFALVLADPPWVPRDHTGLYPEDPLSAIDGGDDGLDVARACLDVVTRHLLPGGSALLQLGTVAQADGLRPVLSGDHGDHDGLAVSEVRQFVRGVVVRIDRSAG